MTEITMKPLRITVAIWLTVLLAAAAPAMAREQVPSQEGIARSPVLAGRTTISGTETAVTEVRIPVPAQIRIQAPGEAGKQIPGMSIAGRGRVAGFYLTQPDVSNPSRTSLLAVRARFCPQSGCRRSDRSHQFVISSDNSATTGGGHEHSKWATIPPGRYLLHLFTDGSPVKIRLRLKGLQGTAAITPSSPVGSGVSLPTVENSTTAPGEKAFWYGHENDFKGQGGFYFGALRMEVKDWSYLKYGVCVEPGAQMPAPLAYSPACPGGFSAGVSRAELIPVDNGFVYPMFAFVNPAGKWGFGQHFAGVFGEAEFDSVAFHMDLNPSAAR